MPKKALTAAMVERIKPPAARQAAIVFLPTLSWSPYGVLRVPSCAC